MSSVARIPAALVAECDVAEGIPAIPSPRAGLQALVLVRVFTEPIGVISHALPEHELGSAALAAAIARALEAPLRERFEACGVPWSGELPLQGVTPQRTPPFVESRERVRRCGPSLTVAVCTHDRPESLERALRGIFAQSYERMRTLVVDNAPSDGRTRALVSSLADSHDVEYAVERRPGLSWARNRAIELAQGEVVAWLDDDEVCDPWWASEIARGFVEVPDADAVTGTVIPSELDTPSQLFFEQYGSLRRHRGFERAIFSPATRRRQSPLYPLPPFGIGANMAFRRSALERIGGFDTALGAGTVTRTAEDTAAMSALLLSGGTIVYQPTALVHHSNRREQDVLRELLLGHGRGLGAFYTSMLLRRPGCVRELLSLAPQAIRDQFSASGQRLGRLEDDFPKELLWANRIGLLQGPFAYARARVHARRLRRMPSSP
ncbi:MAG TPA: glycosyltransferase family 2 protein [Solirubrobacteraceae bacterium]|nr:glycosyltransferase family 2 protein [Solirubrobacteraceae bacterium]